MPHKNDYSFVVFFPNETPKKWAYVHRLDHFVKFLDTKHSNWEYANVYERRTREFIRRIKKGDNVSAFING